MKRITLFAILLAILITTAATQAQTEYVDLSAEPLTRAQQAIALAEAQDMM